MGNCHVNFECLDKRSNWPVERVSSLCKTLISKHANLIRTIVRVSINPPFVHIVIFVNLISPLFAIRVCAGTRACIWRGQTTKERCTTPGSSYCAHRTNNVSIFQRPAQMFSSRLSICYQFNSCTKCSLKTNIPTRRANNGSGCVRACFCQCICSLFFLVILLVIWFYSHNRETFILLYVT